MNLPLPLADDDDVATQLHLRGYAHLSRLISDDTADELIATYDDEQRFRSRVIMRRHGFGEGEYQYFASPLPTVVASLRRSLYRRLAPVANAWADQLRLEHRYPDTLDSMLARCHAAGQSRPTPLMLKYGVGDYNCLHQDLYGEHVFPIQIVILLSDRSGFDGGEFVLTEQRPRRQSRVEVVPLERGHGVAFAVNERPIEGARGYYRVKMRHGVSEIRRGERFTLGIIFHDAG